MDTRGVFPRARSLQVVEKMARPRGVEPPTFWFVVGLTSGVSRVFKWLECSTVDEITVCGLKWASSVQWIAHIILFHPPSVQSRVRGL